MKLIYFQVLGIQFEVPIMDIKKKLNDMFCFICRIATDLPLNVKE